jgi:hypothetical protein
VTTQVDDAKTTLAVLNSTALRVTWEPAELQQVVSVLGNVVVDYRDADIPLGVTGIDCAVYLGNVEILVPDDIDVEIGGTVEPARRRLGGAAAPQHRLLGLDGQRRREGALTGPSAVFEAQPTLRGDRVTLRPLRHGDDDALYTRSAP